jgi:hypothetical protein
VETRSLPSRCIEGPDVEISTAVFTLISEFPMQFFEGQASKGKYLGGAIDLGLDLVRGIDDPIFLPFRGIYFDGHNDFMRFVDFIFSGDASIAVVMRKPTASVGTLFSFDTVSLLNAELAISFEGPGSEIRVYNAGKDKKFDLSIDTNNWIVFGFGWSWSNGNMNFNLSIDQSTETLTIEGLGPYMDH